MKKELYIPLIIVALTLMFGIICLMVYLSDGNAYWIKKKLKIGALLLTITWFVNSCEKSPTIEVTCYDPMPPKNTIWINNSNDTLIYSVKDTMFIHIINPSFPFYSFDITDSSLKSIKSDILKKQNDTTSYDKFYILILTNDFEIGKYIINFFGENDTIVTKKNKIRSHDFFIK
ncbi:MAG: hypothetical protein V1779_15705 [bacterium]